MNIFSKVTIQSLKKNRARTIVTIIGIILSTALICAVTTSIASVQRYAVNYFEYTEGKWHGYEKSSDIGVYNKIKNSDKVSGAGCLSYIGYADIDSENEYKPYLYICGFEENMDGLIPVHIITGRMPENRNEILIPEHLDDNGGVNYNVGDKITLEIGDRKADPDKIAEIGISTGDKDSEYFEHNILTQQNPMTAVGSNDNIVLTAEYIDVRETREFTVVGKYMRPDFEDYFAPGYTALTVPDDVDDFTAADVFYRMKKAKDIYDFKEENGLGGRTHSEVLLLTGVSRYDSFYSFILGMAAVIIGLIMFGSIMLIYNAFAISVSERTKQFGLLSSIGATKKQLRKMVRFEALTLGIIGIPLGIIVGIVGMWITFLAIGSKFTIFSDYNYAEPMRVRVSVVAIVAACIIAFVTIMISAWIPSKRATRISAVEAIRQNSDIKQKKYIRTPKIITQIFGLPGMLAHKYFKRSKKKYRATIISLFMSIVLFVSAYAFTAYLVGAVSDTYETFGMDYSYYVYNNNDDVPEPEKINELIKNTEHITDSTYTVDDCACFAIERKNLRKEVIEKEYIYDDTDYIPVEPDKAYQYIGLSFVEDKKFRKFAEECKLDADEYMNLESPQGIVVDNSLDFNTETGKTERVRYFIKPDFDMTSRIYDDIEGYYFYQLDNGNAIYVKKYAEDINDNTTKKIPIDKCSREFTVHVGAITDKKPGFIESSMATVVYPYSALRAVFGKSADKIRDISFSINSDDIFGGYEALKTSLKENGYSTAELYNYADEVESKRNMVIIVKVFAYGFIILISLIAAANVFNTITTNINLRRRDFAMLKSVGMTTNGMRKMLNYECIMYGTKALVWGLPVSVLVTFFIYKAVNEGVDTDFYIPWAAVIVAVLSVFIVVFSTMMFSMSKIKKDNPIDALKNENL
ncbi:MAG: ABC transporter permease [Ruminococcus sp.]|uniref:ABC transporter permease n=1 Tax=Ruminococcus sp. TaxID=41978 RepID=UPI0025FDF959|nr:ABC transporter permease [Ruminococcus sp.]MCR4796039.1 ABC transporter permease [Ruminococcus sp.]